MRKILTFLVTTTAFAIAADNNLGAALSGSTAAFSAVSSAASLPQRLEDYRKNWSEWVRKTPIVHCTNFLTIEGDHYVIKALGTNVDGGIFSRGLVHFSQGCVADIASKSKMEYGFVIKSLSCLNIDCFNPEDISVVGDFVVPKGSCIYTTEKGLQTLHGYSCIECSSVPNRIKNLFGRNPKSLEDVLSTQIVFPLFNKSPIPNNMFFSVYPRPMSFHCTLGGPDEYSVFGSVVNFSPSAFCEIRTGIIAPLMSKFRSFLIGLRIKAIQGDTELSSQHRQSFFNVIAEDFCKNMRIKKNKDMTSEEFVLRVSNNPFDMTVAFSENQQENIPIWNLEKQACIALVQYLLTLPRKPFEALIKDIPESYYKTFLSHINILMNKQRIEKRIRVAKALGLGEDEEDHVVVSYLYGSWPARTQKSLSAQLEKAKEIEGQLRKELMSMKKPQDYNTLASLLMVTHASFDI